MIIQKRKKPRCLKNDLLLARPWSAHHVLVHQLRPRRFVEYASFAAFVVGKIVPSLCIQVLNVDGVACWTDIQSGSLSNGGKPRPRSYLVIGAVSKLRSRVVHLAADLLEGIGARPGVLP
jgi:hypothetical protein